MFIVYKSIFSYLNRLFENVMSEIIIVELCQKIILIP